MPMPVLDSSATVGDVTGLCLSRKAASTPDAADFMVYELSTEAVSRVTRTGYLAPANLEVALDRRRSCSRAGCRTTRRSSTPASARCASRR